MNAVKIIEKYYEKNSKLYNILIRHSIKVRDKALKIIDNHPELNADRQFVKEASMLHDIGIFMTNAPDIECFGTHEYIEHGYLGSEIVRREGYPLHALVCERHTGVGLTLEWIVKNKLPVPYRDMMPLSIEEQIICYADKFYSKTKFDKEHSVEKILKKLSKYDADRAKDFLEWHKRFG